MPSDFDRNNEGDRFAFLGGGGFEAPFTHRFYSFLRQAEPKPFTDSDYLCASVRRNQNVEDDSAPNVGFPGTVGIDRNGTRDAHWDGNSVYARP